MKAMTRRTHTATNALVAVIVAVLALFAVPTRGALPAPSTAHVFTALAAGVSPVARSALPRKPRVHHSTAVAEPRVPPALPAETILVALPLLLLGALLTVARRVRVFTAFRLPAVRAPPLRLASPALV